MPRERRHHTPGTRSTDASKLSFPLQIVIVIVTGVLAAASGSWATQRGNDRSLAQLQSDVRDVLTRMESDRRLAEINAKLQESNNATMNKTIEANAKQMNDAMASMQRRQELQQYEIQGLKETLLKMAPGTIVPNTTRK